jgi:hypothetical protein
MMEDTVRCDTVLRQHNTVVGSTELSSRATAKRTEPRAYL